MNSIIWRSRHAIAAKWNHAVEAAPSAESLLKKTAIEYGCGLQLCLFTFISPSLWVCVCDWFIFGPSSAVMCCESWGFRELKKNEKLLKGEFWLRLHMCISVCMLCPLPELFYFLWGRVSVHVSPCFFYVGHCATAWYLSRGGFEAAVVPISFFKGAKTWWDGGEKSTYNMGYNTANPLHGKVWFHGC